MGVAYGRTRPRGLFLGANAVHAVSSASSTAFGVVSVFRWHQSSPTLGAVALAAAQLETRRRCRAAGACRVGAWLLVAALELLRLAFGSAWTAMNFASALTLAASAATVGAVVGAV